MLYELIVPKVFKLHKLGKETEMAILIRRIELDSLMQGMIDSKMDSLKIMCT